MTTITINLSESDDLSALEEALTKLGVDYAVKEEDEFAFSKEQIDGFLKTKQDFLDGRTTAKDWRDIQRDLDSAYD